MRWFKHMTNSSQDEKLIQLEEEFGLEGYGAYWKILELIGTQLSSENQQTFVTFSAKSWRKYLGFPPKKLKFFTTFCNKSRIFIVKTEGDKITIDCPNILKYKDEYSRKGGSTKPKTPDKVRSESGATPEEETETETETDIDIKKIKTKKSNSETHSLVADATQKRRRKLPEKFSLSVELRTSAVKYWQKHNRADIDPDDQFERFTNYHRSKGSVMADWEAAWRTWYSNALNFSKAVHHEKNERISTTKPSLVDRVKQNCRQREREIAARSSSGESGTTIDGEIVGAHGRHVRA